MKTTNTKTLFTKRSLHGYTLVELIVVITILAILGLVAFTSLQGFNGSARDSVRVSDISSIRTVLDLFFIKNSSYPSPSDPLKTVAYSGVIIFSEGTFGEITSKQVQILDKQLKDPLYRDVFYTYSVTKRGNQYELGYITENPLSYTSPVIEIALASSPMIAQMSGNYSGSILIPTVGVINSAYTTPSIVTSYNSSGAFDIEDLSGKFVSNGGTDNIPFSYLPPAPPPPPPTSIIFTEAEGTIIPCASCLSYP